MPHQDTTKRGKESERRGLPFRLTTSSLAGSRHSELGKPLAAQEAVGRCGVGGRALSPSSSLPPILMSSFLNLHCPETVLWTGAPIPEPSMGSQRPSGDPLPSPELADALWRSSGDDVPPTKEPGPTPTSGCPAQREGQKEGTWRCPGEPGQGGGVSVGIASHEKLMPPCRLLIFVCFSLFARREGSFISPDCHYPALNFHRAGGRPGKGRQAGGRGGLGAPWAGPAGG